MLQAAQETMLSAGRAFLAFPGEPRYEEARRAFWLTVDQRPAVVALPRDEHEVREAVLLAGDVGLRVAAQRTGHGATALPSLEHTMLLRTDAMREVTIDAEGSRARVGAGARWQDVLPQVSPHRLAARHGSSPDVGVVGYTLGGGTGWYARRHGFAADHVTAVEIVTADGRWRHITPDQDAELFWALRGGGGSFGVVTALEFELVPVPELYAGALFFDWSRSHEVLHAWHEWTAAAPDAITSIARILRLPPMPEIPEPFRGRSLTVISAACLGSAAQGAELLAPLRRLGPEIDTFAPVAPVDIADLQMEPREPVRAQADHQLLERLPSRAIDELVELIGPGSDSPLLTFELRHLGGALGREHPGHGALGIARGAFATFGGGITPDAESARAVRERLDALAQTLEPSSTGFLLPNFATRSGDASRFFPPAILSRLREIRSRVDPAGLFVAKHEV